MVSKVLDNKVLLQIIDKRLIEKSNIFSTSVKVYKKSNKWEISLQSEKHISSKDLDQIKSNFEKLAPNIEIRLSFVVNTTIEQIKNGFDPIWRDLTESLKNNMPAAYALINLCEYELDIKDNVLLVQVIHPSSAKILDDKSIITFMEKWLKERYKHPIIVKFQKDKTDSLESGKDYLTKKEKENEELARKLALASSAKVSRTTKGKEHKATGKIIIGKQIKKQPDPIEKLNDESGRVVIEGKIISKESRELRGGKHLVTFTITDFTSSINVKLFIDSKKANAVIDKLLLDKWYLISGDCQYDKYQREIVVSAYDINLAADRTRVDDAPVKRVELHLHTQMSALDAVSSAKNLVDRAAFWGHDAIAITDHGVVQAFPEAYAQGKKKGIKIIFGVEAYLINDYSPIVIKGNDMDFDQEFVVFDIETTGLNPTRNEIIEIGAVKIRKGELVDSFSSFVKAEERIPENIIKLTGITNDMVQDAPSIGQVLPKFLEFCQDSILVAHNASFDMGFISENAKRLNISFTNSVLDTLSLSREMLRDIKSHRLDKVADHLGLVLTNHHRALDDAQVTGKILLELLKRLKDQGITNLNQINKEFSKRSNLNALRSFHVIILAKNQKGLKNLYKLISKSHMEYFYRTPRIPKSELIEHREGLIIGSACEAGELYRAILDGRSDQDLAKIVEFYDYLEIQPLANNEYLLRNKPDFTNNTLMKINKRIVSLGKAYGRPVVATGDVHFLDPEDEYFRRILMYGRNFEDADHQAPLYFKTTEEMLEEFSYLGEEAAYSVVVKAPRQIADQVEELKPIPDTLFPPEIPGADEEVKSLAQKTAIEMYGDPLPEIVMKRLNRELDSIIGNGYAVLYLIAHKLVKQSLDDGYLVGSRGSVGSSFVATMTGITEVNPLPPHYLCPKCKDSDFEVDKGKYACGVDLPNKNCRVCDTPYMKLGYDIPFEVFMGFKGDKVPDIDLNFSGEYQARAHKFTEELFGEGYVFRAGTISTIAEKTAYGYVKKYLDDKGIIATNAETNRLVKGCTGVKRTTGQHPGGILVVPKKYDIHDFTPIQYPADDRESSTITSHFDFNSIHDTLVKLDILGHEDPTSIKMLEDLTGVDATKIPIGEERTMGIFSGTEALGVDPKEINSSVGTFGVPEFGTRFVRQMLEDTRPTTFAELVRISGLSHGTDVWLNNAQDLIKNNVASLSEVISTRDDIMIYLIYRGMDPTISFQIMESVRKGRGLTPEMEDEMVKHDIPQWYIESCKKIKYMFPKAHAAAYVIMAFRIAYFKVYYPEAFYATYFTAKADDFDAELIYSGQRAVQDTIEYLQGQGRKLTAKENNLLTILEVVVEMFARGISFESIDLYKSHATKFQVTDSGIMPSLNALQGVGVNAAKNIAKAREEGEFISIEDFRERTKVTKTVIEVLKSNDVLKGLPESNQISLF